jgi:anti-anti-sigma factor
MPFSLTVNSSMTEACLSCYTRRDTRATILALEGTLDIATAPQAVESLQQFQKEHGPQVVLDTSRLDFIDSRGVGVLMTAAKSARDAGGCLFLHNPTLPVRKILEMCGVMSLFPPPPADMVQEVTVTERTTERPPARPSASPSRPATRTAKRVA